MSFKNSLRIMRLVVVLMTLVELALLFGAAYYFATGGA